MNASAQFADQTDAAAVDPELSYVPVDAIRVDPQFNPRKKFSDADTEAFAERLANSGWVSPLLVRPDPGNEEGYLLVAGERRLRAIQHLRWSSVPVTVKPMSDEEHHRLALSENVDRKDLTIAEEAMAAREYVDSYGGDHVKAAHMLGWSESRVRHRLLLLHCIPEVMQALLDETIQLGHAELFATLPHENQQRALPHLLERKLTVTEFREQLNGFSQPLKMAIFDKADCSTCPSNSDCQGSLFATHINAGRCTNRVCYQKKTDEALQVKRQDMQGEYAVVVFASEKVPGTTTPLIKHGACGVGEEQFDACRTCSFRGAIINDAPGSAVGSVEGPNCFNLACNQEKVAAYEEQRVGSDQTDDDEGGTEDNASAVPSTAKQTAKNAGKKVAKKAVKKQVGKGKAAAPKSVPAAAQDVYAKAVANAAKATIALDNRFPLALALYSLMRRAADESGDTTFNAIAKGEGLTHKDIGDASRSNTDLVIELSRREEHELLAMMRSVSERIMDAATKDSAFRGNFKRRALVSLIVNERATDLTPHVVVDQAFLDAHTRPAVEHILEESGFRDWMLAKEDGAKQYAALLKEGKTKLIKAVLDSGFDFASYLPSELTKHCRNWAAYR